jgi:serine/threonine-protein kinase
LTESASGLDLIKGMLADRYAVVRELGRGGMATVYLAEDLKHDRQVAVKVLRPELAAAITSERFLKEIRLTAKLDHPHILTLIDSGLVDGLLWYAMPFVRGESLREKLKRHRQLAVEEALSIAQQVAGALDYAHRQGVVHRDLKPENVLLFEGEAILVDFGIALALEDAGDHRLTASGMSLGTPLYMSPEQAAGDRQIDPRSDVYALGTVLYEMLVGEPPHTGSTAQVILAKLVSATPVGIRVLREAVPRHVDSAVMKALSKVPADRFSTAADFATALRRPSAEMAAAVRRFRIAGIFGALVTIALLGFLEWAWRTRSLASPATGIPRQVTFAGNVLSMALSPNGEFLAYVADSKLSVMDLTSGESVRASYDSLRLSSVKWSPDGTEIRLVGNAILTNERATYTTSRLATHLRRLSIGPNAFLLERAGHALIAQTTVDERSKQLRLALRSWPDTIPRDTLTLPPGFGPIDVPDLSPDGRWIVVTADRADSMGIVVLSVPHERANVVLMSGRPLTGAQWTADGDRVEYVAGGAGLMAIDIDRATGSAAGPPKLVVADPQLLRFSVSRDRSRVAYGRYQTRSHLWRVQAETQSPLHNARITNGTASHVAPTVSHDGQRVAFVREASGVHDVFITSPQGEEPKRITFFSDTQSVNAPEWSPDGQRLGFFFQCRPTVLQIETGASHAIGQNNVTSLDCYRNRLLWVRDGAWLAYEGSRGPGDSASLVVTHVLAGGETERLLDWGRPPLSNRGRAVLGAASPSGAQLAFTWETPERFDMWILNLADRSLTPFLPGVQGLPVLWSSDAIYFRRRISSGKPQELWTAAPRDRIPKLFMRLPVRCDRISMSANARVIICDSSNRESDVWIADKPT